MTFAEAMQALQDGKKVRRKCWRNTKFYKKFHSIWLSVYFQDIEATDWEIVDEPKPKRKVTMRFYVWRDTRDSWMGGWWEDNSQDPEENIPTDWVQEVSFEEPEA